MAVNLGRWWKYAQAKLGAAVDSSNQELDQLEAEREAAVADKPWLTSDREAPTLDEARARIAWEAEEQRRRAEAEVDKADTPVTEVKPPTPEDQAADADAAAARVELDRRTREAAERLEAIRAELGVDPPTPT